ASRFSRMIGGDKQIRKIHPIVDLVLLGSIIKLWENDFGIAQQHVLRRTFNNLDALKTLGMIKI
ncbi:MAG: hypothetical protein OCU18_08935, partial [Candidatus Syntrophoarchaeum sp.]|nr:hypothetical protein [Candidatus Syntrophoarchaeum sp.]